MQIVPCLYFNGNADQALDFYAKSFNSDPPQVLRYKDQPSPGMPEEFLDKIMHAELIAHGCIFYIADAMGSNRVTIGNNVQINLNCDNEDQLRWIYQHLSDGGHIHMELQDTFWGAKYAMLKDKFDISWSLNYMKPQA